MKFKVWDKVRVTREWLAKQADSSFVKSYEVSWWTIKKIAGDAIYCPNSEYRYEEEYLELVPEVPEFKFGDIIEVSNDTECWRRALFIAMSLEDREKKYIVAALLRWPQPVYDKVSFVSYKYARKIKPRLTRKEIAEKFWVYEDFELVED